MYQHTFTFGLYSTRVVIQQALPIIGDLASETNRILLVCDTNTEQFAQNIAPDLPRCVLTAGEVSKNWTSVETILTAAHQAGLSRDGLFIGIGGGVISDLTAFVASVYLRGARLCIVSTTLLGMVDAAVGGKTGFDLFGMKNMIGTFYPAELVYMPINSLESLPEYEWKSGMAELIKTAILDKDDEFFFMLSPITKTAEKNDTMLDAVNRAVTIKGNIVEADPRETGSQRILLNLGHTFGHALEATAGLGTLSHGEAVAWGIARACELGLMLGITPPERASAILSLLRTAGYETAAPHPALHDKARFMQALASDKKKKAGALRFIVPAQHGASVVSAEASVLERIIWCNR
jgi:3-dehydroquinate synthase